MIDVAEVLIEIETMLKRLSNDLSEEDKRGGWTEEKRLKYIGLFSKIKQDIQQGKIAEYKARGGSIVRTLDASGIGRGPLAEQAAIVGQSIAHAGAA